MLFTYPSEPVLAEIGRVAIAAARLDTHLGQLWQALDRTVSDEVAMRGRFLVSRLRDAVKAHLAGEWRSSILELVRLCEEVRRKRHAVLHQFLRHDARNREEIQRQFEAEPRGSLDSGGWTRFPATGQPAPLQTLEELQTIETELRQATEHVVACTFRVASMREMRDASYIP